jgi:hypothetical protein
MQFFKLRAKAKTMAASNPIGAWRLLAFALVSVVAALLVGVGVGYAVMFGPSHITGDFIGLPWFTALPALLLGLWATSSVSQATAVALLKRQRK